MNKMKVYFDNTATTPILEEVYSAMHPYFVEQFGNPSSLHEYGEEPRTALAEAREKTARLIGADPAEIYFTSSGSEANNLAIKGLAEANSKKGNHIITSSIEHFSVLNPLKTLEKKGFEITYLPVDSEGMLDPGEVKKVIKKETILVSVMTANNEIGVIQPVEAIGAICAEAEIVFHTDAVGAAGIIPVDVQKINTAALSLAANMFYGPKGAGALFLSRGVRIKPQIEGGIQEEGKRAGTENVPAIVGLGKAAELAVRDIELRSGHLIALRNRLIEGLTGAIPHSYRTGPKENRLPGHASIIIKFIEGESMLMFLNMEGIAVSSGSACTSKALKASHVLMAIGTPHEFAHGSLVLSMGIQNNLEEVEYVIAKLPPIVERLRAMSPLYKKFLESEANGNL